jgi:hypothetical protein
LRRQRRQRSHARLASADLRSGEVLDPTGRRLLVREISCDINGFFRFFDVKNEASRADLTKRHFLICIKYGGEVPTYFRIQEKSPFETGMKIMPSGNRHWLEYDFVAVIVLFVSIGFVALIVLSI